jgi:polysaccharide export outer membrane protein
VGKAGGLLDVQADPGSVFLYRREPRKVAQALGIDLSRYPHEQAIPIIFSVSFLDPGGYFLATQVQMRNRDVIFVANAPSVQVTRFATLLGLFAGNAANASLTSFYAR